MEYIVNEKNQYKNISKNGRTHLVNYIDLYLLDKEINNNNANHPIDILLHTVIKHYVTYHFDIINLVNVTIKNDIQDRFKDRIKINIFDELKENYNHIKNNYDKNIITKEIE